MEDVHGACEPDSVYRTICARPIVLPQFQQACAAEALKNLCLGGHPAKLHQAQALTKLSIHVTWQGQQVAL